jgi:hypothetical protein
MHVARSGHQATLLMDGRVLVTGGSDERGQAIGLAQMFDPLTGTWSAAAANVIPRLGHAASLLHDGRVLVVGGVPFSSSCEPIAVAEVYDPSVDRWSITSHIPVPVGRGTAAVTMSDSMDRRDAARLVGSSRIGVVRSVCSGSDEFSQPSLGFITIREATV